MVSSFLIIIFLLCPLMVMSFVTLWIWLDKSHKADPDRERLARLESEVEELRRLVTDAILDGEEALPRSAGDVRSGRSVDAS